MENKDTPEEETEQKQRKRVEQYLTSQKKINNTSYKGRVGLTVYMCTFSLYSSLVVLCWCEG